MATLLTGAFFTHNEKGQSRQIRVFLKMVDINLLGSHAQPQGLKQLQTASGLMVTALGEGKYKVLVTGEILTADDPSRN